MAYTLTRLQLVTRGRRKADAVGDNHVTDTELNDEVNDLISRIWKEVFAVDRDRVAAVTSITLTGAEEYTLPAAFMSLIRADWVSGSQHVMLEPTTFAEMDLSDQAGAACYYRLVGGGQTGSTERLHIRPDPGTGTIELWYATTAPVLSADGDTYDCRFDEHRYVIAGLARFIAVKQETDPTPHEAEMLDALEHVRTLARRRDAGRAKQIADVRSLNLGWRERLPDP